MSWIKVKDGYVSKDSIVYIRRSTYLYDNKYRLILDLQNGDTAIYNEYDTREECEEVIERLVSSQNTAITIGTPIYNVKIVDGRW